VPARPACHSMRVMRSAVVASGQGVSRTDRALEDQRRRGVRGWPGVLRNTNRVWLMTSARTIWAANAGGQARSAVL
jgi:hypothetical protein